MPTKAHMASSTNLCAAAARTDAELLQFCFPGLLSNPLVMIGSDLQADQKPDYTVQASLKALGARRLLIVEGALGQRSGRGGLAGLKYASPRAEPHTSARMGPAGAQQNHYVHGDWATARAHGP